MVYRFAKENLITSTLCFTKSVIYFRDITVSTKELFKIRLTLVSNSSDCENVITLFAFSFIILFLLLPSKRDIRLKLCISTFFWLFSISHFSSKNSLSLFPVNTVRKFFTYEYIKASNFASMTRFSREPNLFFFFILRYQNNYTYFQLLLLPSGDISFNPGPINGFQEHSYDQRAVFNTRALHIVHSNINSLLPEIDEFPYIAKLSEAVVIVISESKLDESLLSSEIQV